VTAVTWTGSRHPRTRPSSGHPLSSLSKAMTTMEAAAVTPRRRSDSTGAERRPGGQSHHRGEDVLRCSSIGALKSKRNASFDLSRTPSMIAMRRTILEKNTPSSTVATNDSRGADYIPAQQRASSSSHHPMVRQVRRVVARDDDTGRLDEIAPAGGTMTIAESNVGCQSRSGRANAVWRWRRGSVPHRRGSTTHPSDGTAAPAGERNGSGAISASRHKEDTGGM
jgi:hypothetical protein